MVHLLNMLFGCPHKRTTFPITIKVGAGPAAGRKAGTHVVCLDCGKEFAYDWQRMKVVVPAKEPRHGAA